MHKFYSIIHINKKILNRIIFFLFNVCRLLGTCENYIHFCIYIYVGYGMMCLHVYMCEFVVYECMLGFLYRAYKYSIYMYILFNNLMCKLVYIIIIIIHYIIIFYILN